MNQEKLQKIISQTKNLNVLYIEDNVNVREQTVKMLDVFFKNVEIAKDGLEGLNAFKENNKYLSSEFNLVITDLEMPNLDGISMINAIRELNSEIPILVFSAHSNTDYFLKTISAGIDGYILKPYNVEQISNSLMNIIEKNRLSTVNEQIVQLENDFIWNSEVNLLFKDEQEVKLTKNELKLFALFINTKGSLKTYEEIEEYIFVNYDGNSKRVRNLVSRLKTKLDFEIFESIYGHGYKLKYKQFV